MAKAKQSPFQHLRTMALGLPATREDLPWGESAIKVRGKSFVFMRESADEFSLSVKLPQSREFALEYPFTAPTAYGLGKSGWVTASFPGGADVPVDMIEQWIDESYRAIAPKKLVARLDAASDEEPVETIVAPRARKRKEKAKRR